jgi:glutathione S-transferase
MDLFDQRAIADEGAGEYGLSGDMKKTQYVLQLLGAPFCAESLKCILIAAEQGMEMNCGSIALDELNSDDFTAVAEFGMAPALKENDYFTTGSKAITEYINARGLGFSLIPKNITMASEQEMWIDKSRAQSGTSVFALVDETICSGTNDATKIDAAKQTLNPILDDLNELLGKGKFIGGKNYTMADLHWTATCHLIRLAAADMIDSRANIKAWLDGMQSKKSNCGQSLISASLLPSIEDIKANKLNNVVITDF